jgi:hypothetical protein
VQQRGLTLAARCPVCGEAAEHAVADQSVDPGRPYRRHRTVPVIGGAVIVLFAATLVAAWHDFDRTRGDALQRRYRRRPALG